MIGMATTLRNSRLDQITAAMDAGTGPAVLLFFTGTRPATGGAITDQVLLATLTFDEPAATAAAGGTLTLNPITADSSADANGTATWARIEDGDGTFVMDLDVGNIGSDLDIELINEFITAGQVVEIATSTITEGNV